MNSRLTKALPCAVIVALGANSAFATDPANAQLGPVYITPTLDTELGWTDNLFRTKRDEVDTWKSVVEPKVQAWLQNGLNTYSLAWKISDYRYFSSHDDDYTDNTVNLDIHHEFNAKNTLNLYGIYYDGHEERGTGLSEGVGDLLDAPLELERTVFGGDYTFGGQESKGRLKLAARDEDHEYQNFRELTQYRDRDAMQLGGTFFWKVAPRTDVLAEVRYIETEYDTVNPGDTFGSLDSEEYNYFVGMEWAATAKTSGSVRLGMYDREYDSALRKDDDGFSWEVDLTYKPRSYSRFNLESKRHSRETNGLGNTINSSDTTLTWDHDWASRSSTELGFTFGTDDYTDSEREDDRMKLEATYNYALRRWVDLGIGYRWEDRDSDLPLFDYTRNEVFLKADFSL